MRRRATLKDVARAAGVHLSTVSRALNPHTRHLLTPEVVDHIRELSRTLDYHPNAAAHSLRTNRTRTAGIVVPDITNPVFPPIIRGIEDSLAKRGYLAILANTDGHLDREAEIAAMLRARGVDGLVLASVEREDKAVSRLDTEGLPIVTVNRRVDDPAISSVVNDEEDGIRRTLAHLVELGHRAVANIAGPQTLSTGAERYRAFEAHRHAMQLAPDRELVVFAEMFNEAEGRKVSAARTSFCDVACDSRRSSVRTTGSRSARSPPFDVTAWTARAICQSPATTTCRWPIACRRR
jgi:LacI family transcriptional regulator